MHWLGRHRLLVLAFICFFWTSVIVLGHFFPGVPFISAAWRGNDIGARKFSHSPLAIVREDLVEQWWQQIRVWRNHRDPAQPIAAPPCSNPLNPGPAGIAVPFVSAYRPLWTGLGIVAGYGLAVLGLTYYVRDRIGAARWRRLHRLTAIFWLLAIGHTIGAGSDTAQIWFLAASGTLVIPAAVLLLLRWLGRAGGNDGRNAARLPEAPAI